MILVSALAEQDLESIYDYGIDSFGLAQAQKYQAKLLADFNKIAIMPAIWRDASILGAGLFRVNSGRHAIFFRKVDEGIRIVRVLNQSMDMKQHLI